jgi:WD40 repeat protein
MKKFTTYTLSILIAGFISAQHQPFKKVDVEAIKEVSKGLITADKRVITLKFSPAGDRIMVGSGNKIAVYSVSDENSLWTVAGADIEPLSTANIPSANPLLISAQNKWAGGSIFLFNWESGEKVGTLSPFDSGRGGLDFFGITGTSVMAWGGPEGRIFEFNFSTNQISDPNGWPHHEGKVYAVAYGPYGNVFSGGADGKVVKRNNDEGNVSAILSFANPVLTIATNPYIKGTTGNDIFIAAGDNKGNIKVKHLQTGKELYSGQFGNECRLIRFHGTDPDLIIASTKTDVILIDFVKGEVLKKLSFDGNQIWSLDLSMDGSRMAVGLESGDVKLFQL